MDSTFSLSAEATPKGIRLIMNVPDLTIYQLKSHLQKFRQGLVQRNFSANASNPSDEAPERGTKRSRSDTPPSKEERSSGSDNSDAAYDDKDVEIDEGPEVQQQIPEEIQQPQADQIEKPGQKNPASQLMYLQLALENPALESKITYIDGVPIPSYALDSFLEQEAPAAFEQILPPVFEPSPSLCDVSFNTFLDSTVTTTTPVAKEEDNAVLQPISETSIDEFLEIL